MILGIDFSSQLEEEALGARYFANGKEVNPLDLCRENGVSLSRIRVWNRPYDDDGNPYLGGTCDENAVIKLAKMSKEHGYDILLDFHYSDFWVDPQKQCIPKDWLGLDEAAVAQKLHDYTYQVLMHAKREGIDVAYVQIGNEITNGMLWPLGKIDRDVKPSTGYDSLCRFLKAGVKAAKEAFPNIKIIIHLERSYDQEVYQEYFDQLVAHGIEFDIIGMSYYPFWHHSFDELYANVDMCKARYGKEVMITELGYAWTVKDYLPDAKEDQLVIATPDPSVKMPYPFTKEGQKAFIEEMLRRAKEHHVLGVCYWEPFWLPMGGRICWASKPGQKYIHEEKKATRNEWANQTLFDYEGNALPALFAFSEKE